LRYLEKGSEKSFKNFRIALERSGQRFLVNVMDNAVVSQQVVSERKQVLGEVPAESGPVSCTEHNTDVTKTSSAEIATESTQGILLILYYCLLEFYLSALTRKT